MTPQQFSHVADFFPHAALLLTPDGTILAANRAFLELTGLSEDVVGQNLSDLLIGPDESLKEYLKLCSSRKEPAVASLKFRRGEDSIQQCQCCGSAFELRPGESANTIFLRLIDESPTSSQFGSLNQKIDELSEEIHRRQQAEQSLREYGELLKVTVSSIGDAVITTDSQGVVTFINPVAEEITGWDLPSATGKPLEGIFHIVNEQTRLPVENPVAKVLREGRIVGLANHTILLAKDGNERPIDDSAAPIRNHQGDIVGVVLVFRDVTAHRRDERVRRQLSAIVESSDDAIFSKALNGIVTSWNRAAQRIYGYSAEEMIGKSFSILVPPTHVEESLNVLQRMRQGQRIDPFETERITKDGRQIDVVVSYSPLVQEDGELIGISVIAHDVTDQKRAEQRAREDRSRLESTLAAVEIGTWEFDIVHNSVRADRNLARMYGVSDDDASGGPLESYVGAIHPDDRVRVSQTISAALGSGQTFESEYRVVDSEGTERWIVARGRIERDSQGRAIRLPGVAIDITDRKAAQEREGMLAAQAATANAQFRAFFEQGAIFAWIMGLDGTIIESNRLSLDACGYTREQVVGKPVWECPWWNHDPEIMERIHTASKVAVQGASFRAELPYFVADGSQRTVDLSILPIKDATGRVLFLASTGMDITDRLRTEMALRESEGRHRFLIQLSQATQPLGDPDEIMSVTARLLAEHLNVSRCAYAEIAEESTFVITGDHSFGVPSIVGRWPVAAFGDECQRLMLANQPYVVDDVKSDSRIHAENLSAYHATSIAAVICVPLHKDGKFTAAMAVHQSEKRIWIPTEIELVKAVVARCWETLERARGAQAERRLHAEVAAEQARLEDIFRFAPSFMAVLSGPEHHFERVNERYATLVGNRHLIGQPVRQALPEIEAQGVVEILDHVFQTGEPYLATDARLMIRVGTDEALQERILDFVYQPMRDAAGQVSGILVQGIDLTERRRAEASLIRVTAESERRKRLYEAALSNTPDLVYTFDLQYRFTYANEALLKMWGKTWDEAIGRTCLELGYEAWHAEMHHREIDKVRETKQSVRGEVPFTGTKGRRIYDYIFAPVIGADGEVEAVTGTTRDITDRQAMEQELRETDRRKDEFLAMLAHELRNPLAPVRTGVELLSLNGVEHECLDVMRNQIDHLVHLVDDLLDVSRITRGKIQLRREPVDLVTIAQRAVESIRPATTVRQHTLTVSMPTAAIWVDADAVRLSQIIANLLNNAVKYTEPGGKIWLTISQNSDAVLSVRDNGIGLDSQLLPRVFDLFIQADRSLERSEGGLGIGLTLVKNLVEMHDGHVQAFSDGPGQGSEFVVTLPILNFKPEPIVSQMPPLNSQKLRILVVDDNVGTTIIQSKLLAKLGNHEVKTAHDGPEAIRVAQEFHPDLIFLDIGLPQMSGYDVARHLRGLPEFEQTLLVASTGYGTEDDRQRSSEAGFDVHVVKPPGIDVLRGILSHTKLGSNPFPEDSKP